MFQNEQNDRLGIMVASHNEDTVRYAIQLMKEHGIGPGDKVVCFGQLLGMCDHITFPLGELHIKHLYAEVILLHRTNLLLYICIYIYIDIKIFKKLIQ